MVNVNMFDREGQEKMRSTNLLCVSSAKFALPADCSMVTLGVSKYIKRLSFYSCYYFFVANLCTHNHLTFYFSHGCVSNGNNRPPQRV